MDRSNPLSIFSSDGNFQRHYIEGPASRKCLPKDMSLLDSKLNANSRVFKKGKDYVKEYVEQEELDLLESKSYQTSNANDYELISLGNAPTDDVQQELLHVYNTYKFAHTTKPGLIVTSKRDQIVSMIETNSVVVIQGPTGCGKSTQVPQFILDSCYKKKAHCNIIVTQPRRIAAISIAKRVSHERNWPVGTLVGYQVGLINHTSKDTRLTYCTTGVLLQKLINAKNMLDYTHVVLDEVHERNEDMDFLLLVVRKLLRTNSRFVKVVLMSATFDIKKFAAYFSSPACNKLTPAPTITIPKESFFTTSIFYICQIGTLAPLPEVFESEPCVSKNMMNFCVQLIKLLDPLDEKADDTNFNLETDVFERHVVLIFLPGINEIEEVHNMLSAPQYKHVKWDIVILHSSITNEEQQRIFKKPPYGYRRLILSTNIAESSLTVPDVKYVIDFCLTKQLVTDPSSNFQCLELKWASKVNCEQRAGRTGRVMDGRVYRLVPKRFYEDVLPVDVEPEILRAPLEQVVLKTKLLDMGEPKALLALSLDPPDLGNLERTILLLKEAGGLLCKPNDMETLDGEITDLGRIMASLPVNIHLAKLMMLGYVFGVLRDTIVIAASLSVKDVFNNPFKQRMLSYHMRQKWADNSCSDCIAFMNVYKVWLVDKFNGVIQNDEDERKWAIRNYLQIRVLREVKALETELTSRLEKLGIQETTGVDKVVWEDHHRSLVLKLVIAGAFYPNYFVKDVLNKEFVESDGIRQTGGLPPAKTVYLQGWPARQPGPLYARRIQDTFQHHLKEDSKNIKVSFDNSSRVYVEFIRKEANQKIHSNVYKAIKMRQCNIPIEIPMLHETVANQLAEEMNLNKRSTLFTAVEWRKNKFRPKLPGLRLERIPLILQKATNPASFWAQLRSTEVKKHITTIQETIDRMKYHAQSYTDPPAAGTIVIVLYEQNKYRASFRAIVQSYTKSSELEKNVQVFFLDHGFSTECRLRDLRYLDPSCEIANIPALAFECKLAHVRPSSLQTLNDNNWSEAACNFFWKIVNKPGQLYGEIYSVVNSVVTLELMHKSEQGDDVININKVLIDEKYAIEKEEDYFSRNNHDLRRKALEMSAEQCAYYEEMQYVENYLLENYPDPPERNECVTTLNLRGPYSPLEIELVNLTKAGKNKRVKVVSNSINSVLLDTEPEDKSYRLLVAGSVSQSMHSHNLTLFNTTLMPRFPGLTALTVLIFTPYMELRRNNYGTSYIGALCGLGYDIDSKKSTFPEHDIELIFDAEITSDDLGFINRLRHWMNLGMQINSQSEGTTNMEEIIMCQNRIHEAFLKLFETERKPRTPEIIYNFDKWGYYDESLLLQPMRASLLTNSIYRLHNALELETNTGVENDIEHAMQLRRLLTEDPRREENKNILCKFCNVTLTDIFDLRNHLFTAKHRRNQEKAGVTL